MWTSSCSTAVIIATDATQPNPTMLGPAQKRWLLDKLQSSTATFKVIASSVPWAFGTKGGTSTREDGTIINRGIDTWEGYPDKREEILFSFPRSAVRMRTGP